MSDKWVNGIGKVLRDKSDDKKFYIKVDKSVALNEGDYIKMEKYVDFIDAKVERGFITGNEADEKKEKNSWIKYILHKGPTRTA